MYPNLDFKLEFEMLKSNRSDIKNYVLFKVFLLQVSRNVNVKFEFEPACKVGTLSH